METLYVIGIITLFICISYMVILPILWKRMNKFNQSLFERCWEHEKFLMTIYDRCDEQIQEEIEKYLNNVPPLR
jgi:hypothetical protein